MSEQRLDDTGGTMAPDAPAPESVQPAAEPAPSPGGDELERALAEFDQSVPQAAPAPAAEPPPAEPNAVDQQLDPAGVRQDLLRQASENLGLDPTAGPTELERQVWIASEQKYFAEYAASIQEKIPDHLGADYARRWMLSEAATNPVLRLAWDMRDVSPAQARAELHRVQIAFNQLRMNPAANPAQVAELEQYAEQLSVAVNARAILRQAELRLVNEARKSKRPIDPDATEDRAAIVAAVTRGASDDYVPEPQVNLGTLTNQEFAKHTREKYGF